VFAAIKIGAIPIPVSNQFTTKEIKFIQQDSKARFLVNKNLQSDEVVVLDLLTGSSHHVREFINDGSCFTAIQSDENDAAYCLYTSGTEGTPKAVIHAHRSIPAHDYRVKNWLGFKKGDVVLNTSALNWSYALTGAVMDVLRHGGVAVFLAEELTAENILRAIQEQNVSVLMSVPGIYRRFVAHLKAQPDFKSKLHSCVSAGETLSSSLRTSFLDLTGINIREGLGMTEHSVYLVQSKESAVKLGSCGKPVESECVQIQRGDGKEASVNEVGVIATHKNAKGLMLGYQDFSSENSLPKLPLKQEWFPSGDLARRDEDGDYFFVGRQDDMITAGGYKVSPLEVEAVLNNHADVLESCVIGSAEENGRTFVLAVIVLKENSQTANREESLQKYAEENLAYFKRPKKYVFSEYLPRSRNGKLLRRELKVGAS
jgi:acetyl-CoA synthetase